MSDGDGFVVIVVEGLPGVVAVGAGEFGGVEGLADIFAGHGGQHGGGAGVAPHPDVVDPLVAEPGDLVEGAGKVLFEGGIEVEALKAEGEVEGEGVGGGERRGDGGGLGEEGAS